MTIVLSNSKPAREEAQVSVPKDGIVIFVYILLCLWATGWAPRNFLHQHSSTRGACRAEQCSWVMSLIVSLISPNSSWQGSFQAISGNKNSLHTSVLIFPLLCLLLKCFSLLPLLKKQHCNYWKLALPAACPWDGRAWLMLLGSGGGEARAHVPVLSSSSKLVNGLILKWLLGV